MEIPLLDLKAQYQSIKKEIDDVLMKIVSGQHFVLSKEVDALEKEVSDYCGVSYAAGVASGTDALFLALRVLGVGKGDLVITTPFTFFATAEAISILGAQPLFAEIDSETYNINSDKIEELIENMEPEKRLLLKAIVPVHLYGQCADMDPIMALAEKYGLKVVEDCAQAIGALYKGRKAGSLGDAGCLSFFPSKNLGCFGDGGMVVSRDKGIIERIKKLRVHGSSEQYIHEEIGCNSRLDSLQAGILRVKLKKLDMWLRERRDIAKRYNEALEPLGITIPKVLKNTLHTYHQYTIAVDRRDELLEYLKNNGIYARVYYPVPLHLQPCYKNLGLSIGSFPVSEKAAGRILSLPIYPELDDKQVKYIIKTVTDFIKG